MFCVFSVLSLISYSFFQASGVHLRTAPTTIGITVTFMFHSFFNYFSILWELSTLALADGLPLEPKWLQVTSSLQDSVQYSGRAFISNSSWPYTNPLVTVPGAPITIGITVTFMYYYYYLVKKDQDIRRQHLTREGLEPFLWSLSHLFLINMWNEVKDYDNKPLKGDLPTPCFLHLFVVRILYEEGL